MKWRGREQVDMTNLKTMNLTLRAGKPDDARRCGEICFIAFATISNHHNFPLDIPTPETAIGLMTRLLSRPDVYSVVAEVDGKIVGSNFLWEGDPIAAIGPITIDPTSQNAGVGRQLMQDVMKRAKQKDFAGVRLVQTTFHNRSLALYAKLGMRNSALKCASRWRLCMARCREDRSMVSRFGWLPTATWNPAVSCAGKFTDTIGKTNCWAQYNKKPRRWWNAKEG